MERAASRYNHAMLPSPFLGLKLCALLKYVSATLRRVCVSSGCATARDTTDTCVASCVINLFTYYEILWHLFSVDLSSDPTILGVKKALWYVVFSTDARVLL